LGIPHELISANMSNAIINPVMFRLDIVCLLQFRIVTGLDYRAITVHIKGNPAVVHQSG
jgi:hypothetical protein